jgi:hypothetical protein
MKPDEMKPDEICFDGYDVSFLNDARGELFFSDNIDYEHMRKTALSDIDDLCREPISYTFKLKNSANVFRGLRAFFKKQRLPRKLKKKLKKENAYYYSVVNILLKGIKIED